MSILVSGSVALDHIMVFPDRFRNHILPDKLHILNVSFNIASLKTHFGGVAGNIAYHLRLLGSDPRIVAAVGNDFGSYADWLDTHGIDRAGIRILDDVRTAQGFVTTDLDDNQIWAFYEGAMARAHEARVEDHAAGVELAIVSSNSKRAMLEHARALKRRGIPTFIDPSHGLPLLSGAELLELIDGAAGYVVNDYELSLTLQQTGSSEDELCERCEALVVTCGEKGSTIREGGRRHEIPPVVAGRVVDPTGCGDAYRAGLLHGRALGRDWPVAGRIGSLLSGAELLELIDGAAGYVVNDYELSLTLQQTGLSEDELCERCEALVVTRGEKGSTIREGGRRHEIPPVVAGRLVDPTGCGDAYRAGLLHGRALGRDWPVAGRIGSLLGSLQVGIEGTQNLRFGEGELRERFEREFGARL